MNSYLYLSWFVLSQLVNVTALPSAGVSVQLLDHTPTFRDPVQASGPGQKALRAAAEA